jgi:glycosyltransferase involved in cell wall biosynthesis
MKIAVLASHPIQYHAPLFRALALHCDLMVFFAHQQDQQGQAAAGYGVGFEWDVDLLTGYAHTFLHNRSRHPSTGHFAGCDTPDIADHLQDGKWDALLLMGWNLKSYWQGIFAARRAGIATFVRGDSHARAANQRWWARIVKGILYRFAFRLPTGFFLQSRHSLEYVRGFGVSGDRMRVHAHVIDVARWQAQVAAQDQTRLEELRAQLGIGAERNIALFVGRMLPVKRADLCIAALADASLRERWSLLLVGEGPQRAVLERQAQAAGVHTVFAGFVNQSALAPFYALADVLLIPRPETWGLVANEALACGTPVIASDAAGCAGDLIREGGNGLLFVDGNAGDLQRALREFAVRGKRGFANAVEQSVGDFQPDAVAQVLLRDVAVLRTA